MPPCTASPPMGKPLLLLAFVLARQSMNPSPPPPPPKSNNHHVLSHLLLSSSSLILRLFLRSTDSLTVLHYSQGKRDLFICQMIPLYKAKETYLYGDAAHWTSTASSPLYGNAAHWTSTASPPAPPAPPASPPPPDAATTLATSSFRPASLAPCDNSEEARERGEKARERGEEARERGEARSCRQFAHAIAVCLEQFAGLSGTAARRGGRRREAKGGRE